MKWYVITALPYIFIIIIGGLLSLNNFQMLFIGCICGLAYFGMIVPKVRSFIKDREDE